MISYYDICTFSILHVFSIYLYFPKLEIMASNRKSEGFDSQMLGQRMTKAKRYNVHRFGRWQVKKCQIENVAKAGNAEMKYLLLVFAAISLLNGCRSSANGIDSGLEYTTPQKWHSVKVVTNNVRAGEYAIRFELRPGEKSWRDTGKSHHCELSEYRKFRARMGQDFWYGFSMYIPQNFPSNWISKTEWLILGQWHGKSDFGEISRSPPLAQYYSPAEDIISIRVRYFRRRLQIKEFKYWSGDEILSLRLKRDVWHDFIYHVKWSYESDGFVEIWIDGDKKCSYEGPVGYNDAEGPYFKYGIYAGGLPETYVVYFDEYRRGNSYEEVDPAQNHYTK